MSTRDANADTSMTRLHVLCAGAAKGLVDALQARFAEDSGVTVEARFGAVGAMKEALEGGAACDVMIVTDALISTLSSSGDVRGETRAVIGSVRTGIAVRAGDALPDISSAGSLKSSLLAAQGIYIPDPLRATAGIHFATLLQKLGIDTAVASRLQTFPNGATAMRELAASPLRHPIGCTQITEINYTAGVRLVGALPGEFELATVYAAAVGTNAALPELAQRFVRLLAGPQTRDLRIAGGFELAPR